MPMYNLIQCIDNYSKTSGILWQYWRNEPALADDDTIADFTETNAITNSFKVKEAMTDQAYNDGINNVEIMVPLKYLSIFL